MTDAEKLIDDKWWDEQAQDEDYLKEQARQDESKRQARQRELNKQWVGFEQ